MKENKYLDLSLTQRSCDFVLGVPFNIASYALLCHIFAAECNLQPGVFTWFGNSVHIYENQIEVAKEQLTREPYPLCELKFTKKDDMFTMTYKNGGLYMSKGQETKREKFVRLAEARTNKIIDMLQLLGNCSNSSVYDYTQQDVDKIFTAIEAEVREAKKKFNKIESKKSSRFTLD